MIKRIIFSVLFIFVLAGIYLFYNEISFSPLRNSDLSKIFKDYSGVHTKCCSNDFIGISSKGEFYEIYKYKISGAIISRDFPTLTQWESSLIGGNAIVGKWKNCLLNKDVMELFKFTLTSPNLDEINCFHLINKEILNPNNYYCYIHFNELEQYFFLYCTDTKEFYYFRRKGF